MPVGIVEPFDQYPDLDSTNGLKLTSNWAASGAVTSRMTLAQGFNGSGKCLSNTTNTNQCTFRHSFPATTQISVAWGFRVNTHFALTAAFVQFDSANLAAQFSLRYNADRTVSLIGEGGAVVATSSLQLQLGVVYRMTLKADITTPGSNVAVFKANGEELFSVSGADLQDDSLGTISSMLILTASGAGNSMHDWDDIYLLYDEYVDLPELELSLYGPSADTADDDWVPSTGTDNFAVLDELPISASDYVTSDTVGAKDILTYADEARIAEEIVSVSLMFAGSKDEVGTRTAKQILKAGGVEYSGADHNWSTTPTIKFDHWRENPNTTNPWAEGEVDALQAGYELVL